MIDRQPAGESSRGWSVRQIIDDPEGDHDFAIVATVDLDASDAAGEPVILTASFAAAGIRPEAPGRPVRQSSLASCTWTSRISSSSGSTRP